MSAENDRRVAVVVTVLNECAELERLFDSLAHQTRPPDEVVVVDGGSTDGTWQALERAAGLGRLPLAILSRPGANIAAGRNAGIASASAEWIACTDAGVRLDPGWLEALIAPLARGAEAVSGFFVSDPEGPFETALGATTLPELDEVVPERFLPSSRSVAFRRAAWEAVGGYPEWLDYCEDLVFDFRLLEHVGHFAFAPEAIVHFRPRRSFRAFLLQYYRYARGDGKADLWRVRHGVRYLTYLVIGPGLFILALQGQPLAWLLLFLGWALMLRRPYRRLWHQWSRLSVAQRLQAVGWVPVIRVGGDVAKMVGYPVGWVWRWRLRPPPWRPRPGIGHW